MKDVLVTEKEQDKFWNSYDGKIIQEEGKRQKTWKTLKNYVFISDFIL